MNDLLRNKKKNELYRKEQDKIQMIYYETELYHHGVKGMKWGVRRYQNPDGSLTAAGRKRYGEDLSGYSSKKAARVAKKLGKQLYKNEKEAARILETRDKYRNRIESKYDRKIDRAKSKTQTPKQEGKLKSLQAKKQGKLKDFDDGTRYVSDGYKKYSDIISNYKNATIKSFEDVAYKNSDSYKRAVKQYTDQRIADMNNVLLYGTKGMTTYNYSREAARADYKKRGLL